MYIYPPDYDHYNTTSSSVFMQEIMLHLLAWVLLSCVSSTTAATNTTSASAAAETQNILKGSNITKPGCRSKCGNLTVPYPFGIGIGSGCGFDESFELNCTDASDPPLALLQLQPLGFDDLPEIQVFAFSDSRLRVSTFLWSSNCYDRTGLVNETYTPRVDLSGTPYIYSDLNMMTVIGCNDSGTVNGGAGVASFGRNCDAVCSRTQEVVAGDCSGRGCCQSSLLEGLGYYSTFVISESNHSDVLSFNPCGYIFVGEQDLFEFRGASDLSDPDLMKRVRATVPTVLDWWIGNFTCEEAKNACMDNSHCLDSDTGFGGHRCECDSGYQGNPYLDHGCTDIDECLDQNLNNCEKICTNSLGSFNCSCPAGQHGDGRKNGKGCLSNNPKFPLVKVVLGSVFGLLSLVMAATCLFYSIKKRKLLNRRQKYFQRNGGLLLQQQLSSKEGSPESTKIFTAEELEKATDSYSNDRILGKGGNGVVYKGILPDETIVAVKKSRELDPNQIDQFINEVVILVQVNHRNVVKFLGCCLESEVPLLVFEYIPNGTLFEHIQRKSNWLSLENRLKIASEAAGALSYLHSSASTPIIHRDVKSANILLDEHFAAKIADFGASRLIPLDQTRVTTMVIGTFGYLDPEYFWTSHLTEKSDVYSFGVVLVELLTGGIPVDMGMSEDQRNLVTNFLNLMNENRLFEILEPRVVREGSFEQLQAVARLIKKCCLLNRDERPSMREVAAEIEVLRKNMWRQRSVDGEEAVSLGSVDLYGAPVSPYNSTQEFTPLYSWSSSGTSEI